MKKLYKWIEERPTIHNYETDSMKISVHQYIGCGSRWFLSTNRLDISQMDLHTTDLEKAKFEAIEYVRVYVQALLVELGKI